ncbi:MAG: hypothetical protein FWG51_02695 [Firmicutes bacterium]|nr:hypothetical protein [Bacillota bacterium]
MKDAKFKRSKGAQMDELRDISDKVETAINITNAEIKESKVIQEEIIRIIEGLSDAEAELWIPRLEREESKCNVIMASVNTMNVCAAALTEIISRLEVMCHQYELTGSDYYYKVINEFVDVVTIRKYLGDYKALATIINKISAEFNKKCDEAQKQYNAYIKGVSETIGKTEGRSERLEKIREIQAQKDSIKTEFNFDTAKIAEAIDTTNATDAVKDINKRT